VGSWKAVAAIVAAFLLGAGCSKRAPRSESADTAASAIAPANTAAVGAGNLAGAAVPSRSSAQSVKPPVTRSATVQRDTNRPRTTPRRVDNPCGGVHVNVIVRVAALGGATDMMSVDVALRNVAKELLAPLASSVIAGSEQFSPAIRTFRVATRDRAAAGVVVSRLRSAPQVQNAELDECGVRAQ